MSLQSWKKEFYPKPATSRMSKIAAIEHSLQKWTGLLPENLAKHYLDVIEGSIRYSDNETEEWFSIDGTSCALCVKYYDSQDQDKDDFPMRCIKCPLCKTLWGTSCDFHSSSPYGIWQGDHNPVPMIEALKKTLKMVKGE